MYCVLLQKNNMRWDNKSKTMFYDNPRLENPCGSTHYTKLDGRKSPENLHMDCMEIFNKSQSFKKYDGFMMIINITDTKPTYIYNPENLPIGRM